MPDQPSLYVGGDQVNMGSGDYVHGNQYKYEWKEAPPQPVDPAVLDAARRHLASLPLDRVPDVAPALPSGSRMSLSPNPLFVGRDDDLRWLAQLFQGAAASGRGQTAAVIGIGGLGKTQLVSEFVHRYGQFFDGGVFWLSFASPETVPAEVAICGSGLNLRPDFATLALADQVGLVESAWQKLLPRLLIFDNCEDEQLLQQWRPPGGGCHILLTSRRAHYDSILDVHPLALAVLARDASIALLRKHRPDLPPTDPALAAIAEELGNLPLALQLAGSFLAKYRNAITPGAYLDRLHKPNLLADRSLQNLGVSPTKRTESLARTFALSYERLDGTDPTDALALQALARVPCFASGVLLPRDLLEQTLDLPKDEPDASLQFTDAVLRLIDLGLLETEGDNALRLHRLIAAFVRSITMDQTAQEAVEKTIIQVASHYNNEGNQRPLLALQPHLQAITDNARKRMDEPAATLCNAFGYHLAMIGDYAGARPYGERALAIREQVLGAMHPDTATSLDNLGALLLAQGDYAGARLYLERALAIREQVLGAMHPDTATSLNNLGAFLQGLGDYAGAQPYYRRALAIWEQVLGAMHANTAASFNNLGTLLQWQGNYTEARPYLERALAIREEVLGPTHPDTATSLNNLGALLQGQGDYMEARPYLERALAIREEVLGPTHPDTARSLNHLGYLLKAQGDYTAARPYYERALTICEHRIGPTPHHPNDPRQFACP